MASSSQDIPITTPTATPKDLEYVLYRALLKEDWDKIQEIIDKDENARTFKFKDVLNGYSVLHAVVNTAGKNPNFVENFLKKIDSKSLATVVDDIGHTALHFAAWNGNTEAAGMLVEHNPCLLYIANKRNVLPVFTALWLPNKGTFKYMLDASKHYIGLSQQYGLHSPFEGINGVELLNRVIDEELFDDALELIMVNPNLAGTVDDGEEKITPLLCIARKADAYYSRTHYNSFQSLVYRYVPIENFDSLSRTEKVQDVESLTNQGTGNLDTMCLFGFGSCFHTVIQRVYVKFWKIALQVLLMKRIYKDKMKHKTVVLLLNRICEEVWKLNSERDYKSHFLGATFSAAMNDTHEAIEAIVESFPQAAWSSDDDDCYLIQLAIKNRSVDTYILLSQKIRNKDYQRSFIDKDGNNLTHLAGHLPPVHRLEVVSGAALQMQRELQWFEDVQDFALSWLKEQKNYNKETPIMVFQREHRELRKEGEEWMRKTAESYTIVTTLIITVVFAAAITVPGGTDQETGQAVFNKKIGFIVFAISDAISLFGSITSLLWFLSILTARYAYEDFRDSLPRKLMFGLATLFMSLTSMMVAFSATLYLMFGQGKTWILIPIAALTCMPIASFVLLQFPLLCTLIKSTRGHIFYKLSDHKIVNAIRQ